MYYSLKKKYGINTLKVNRSDTSQHSHTYKALAERSVFRHLYFACLGSVRIRVSIQQKCTQRKIEEKRKKTCLYMFTYKGNYVYVHDWQWQWQQ